MTRTAKTPTAVCRHCRQWSAEGCGCTDYKRCRDCPMPRCVLLADSHPGARA